MDTNSPAELANDPLDAVPDAVAAALAARIGGLVSARAVDACDPDDDSYSYGLGPRPSQLPGHYDSPCRLER